VRSGHGARLPLTAALLWGLAMLAPVSASARDLKLASWNLEWLVSTATTREARNACLTGARPRLPCNVALDQARSATDFAALARLARNLDADVIAIQEVESAEVAALVFPGYRFCLSEGRVVQNLGFAIRRGLPYRCEADLRELSLGEHLRRGVVVSLYPGTAQSVRLLGVHLKSGCPRSRLPSATSACRQWQSQLPQLVGWISQQSRQRQPFAVLGDFNRELGPDDPAGLWMSLDAAGQRAGGLADAAAGTPFRNCRAGQNYASSIDHIFLGGGLQPLQVPGSFARVTFPPADARRYRLSDHCPIVTRLKIPA
jgi:endonuclease/exonuclease/phosphatase family metal-dependent hydrolase